MKKIIIAICCLLFSSMVFAEEVKMNNSFSYVFGNFINIDGPEKTTFTCNGINVVLSPYFNDNWGLLLDGSFNLPFMVTDKIGSTTTVLKNNDFGFSLLLSFIVAPSYRYYFSDNFCVYGSLGAHFAQLVYHPKDVTLMRFSLGLGGDAGVRYFLSDNFFLTGGCIYSYDFYSFGERNLAGLGTEKISEPCNFLSYRPYIGIGFIK